jgi:hypothetical protein
MKQLLLFLFCLPLFTQAQNLVLNGSFELNNPIVDSITGVISCYNDLPFEYEYVSAVFFSNTFGNDYTTTLWELPCLICSSVLFGGQAKEGDFVLEIFGYHQKIVLPWQPNDTTHLIGQGKISLELNIPLSTEKRYKLSFWIKHPKKILPCGDIKNNYINVGISNYEDSLGRHLITTNYGDTIWEEYTYVFETQMAEEYITVTVGVNDTIDHGVFIDHFVLTETTEALTTGVNELYSKKQLLKIVDILGRESKSKKGLLFYIYSDGTVEKRIIVE